MTGRNILLKKYLSAKPVHVCISVLVKYACASKMNAAKREALEHIFLNYYFAISM